GFSWGKYSGWLGKIPGLRKPVFNPKIEVVANPVGSTVANVTKHESLHAYDMLNRPQFSWWALGSRLPGRGIANYIFETRAYYLEYGAKGLLPSYAWRSMPEIARRYFVVEVGVV